MHWIEGGDASGEGEVFLGWGIPGAGHHSPSVVEFHNSGYGCVG